MTTAAPSLDRLSPARNGRFWRIAEACTVLGIGPRELRRRIGGRLYRRRFVRPCQFLKLQMDEAT